jgi:hypothetical protein
MECPSVSVFTLSLHRFLIAFRLAWLQTGWDKIKRAMARGGVAATSLSCEDQGLEFIG